MLAYTPVSESGGVGKTTTAATLAAAHADAGLDVLAIDMDTQNGSLTYLLGVDSDRADQDADNLVRHMVGRPRGNFEDLIRPAYGFDVVPSHAYLEDLPEFLIRERRQAEDLGESFGMYHQLRRVLREAGVRDDYDVLIVDTPGKADHALYNALVAVQHVVIPFEASAKGVQSIDGLDDLVSGLEEQLGIDVGVLAVIPIGVKGTTDQRDVLDELEGRGFDVPAVIGERASLMEGCWKQQCPPQTFVDEHRDRRREYELETLEQYAAIARHLEDQADLRPTEVTA